MKREGERKGLRFRALEVVNEDERPKSISMIGAISKVQTKAPTTGANLAKKLKERGVVPPATHPAAHTAPPPTGLPRE